MRRLVTVLVSMAAALLPSASPVYASCAGPASVERDIARSDLVFVGNVVGLDNRDRWATFAVEDIWKGNPGGRTVEVRAGPEDPGGGLLRSSSNDRTFQAGVRYLVFALGASGDGASGFYGPDARWSDSTCSSTQPYTPDLGRYRPPSLAGPNGSSTGPQGVRPSAWADDGRAEATGLILLVGAIALTSALLVRRCRAQPSASRQG